MSFIHPILPEGRFIRNFLVGSAIVIGGAGIALGLNAESTIAQREANQSEAAKKSIKNNVKSEIIGWQDALDLKYKQGVNVGKKAVIDSINNAKKIKI